MDGGSGLKKTNPADAGKQGIKPGFLGGKGGGDKPFGYKDGSGKEGAGRRAGVAEELRGVDNSALGAVAQAAEGLGGVRERETSGGLYTGRGVSEKEKKKGRFFDGKMAGFSIGILLTIFGVGGMMLGSQAFQLFAWNANLDLDFNQSSAVINRRSNFILKNMLNSNKDLTRTDIFGRDKYKIPTSLESKLKSNNIDVVETTGTDGKKLRMLVYTEADGNKVPVVASENDLSRIPAKINETGVGEITLSDKHLTLDQAKNTDSNFRVSLDNATITFTGRVAGWFDSLTTSFLRRVGGSSPRNKLRSLGENPSEDSVKELMFKNVAKGTDDTDAAGITTEKDDEMVRTTNEDFTGNGADSNGDDSLKVGETNTAQIESKLKTTVKKAAIGGNVACAGLRAVGAINAVVAGIQVANAIDKALIVLEASDKTKAGDGDDTTNIISNLLNTKTSQTAYDINGDEVTLTGSVTDSDGWNEVFSSKNIVDEKDPAALMVNREYATKNALRNANFETNAFSGIVGHAATSVEAFTACLGIQMAVGIADAVTDGILLFTTAGIGNAVKKFVVGVFKGAVATSAVIALTTAIAFIAPMVGQWLAGNLDDVSSGIIGGHMLYSGAHAIYNGNLQMTTGVNASKEQVMELYGVSREVEKEWAEYDRATLSPFDVTSRNTFFGSLAYSAMPIVNDLRSLNFSSVVSFGNLLDSSIIALSGNTVNAASDRAQFKLSLYESDDNCSNLSGMGVAGDAYCNKYSGAYMDDLTTISSAEIYDKISDQFDGVDANGNPKIKSTSDYAKYIIACQTSDSQPGEVSANVQGSIEKMSQAASGGTVAGGAIIGMASNFVPGSGIIDAIEAGQQFDNLKWNTQAACSDPKYRYFSDYSVDQRVLEDMGVIEQSAVSVFLDDYYKENPLDNSPEGIIARYSGLSKEEVTDTIALIEYIDFIANYDPSERYAFEGTSKEEKYKVMLEGENVMDGEVPALAGIVYADVRNRNFVV